MKIIELDEKINSIREDHIDLSDLESKIKNKTNNSKSL